MPRLAFLLVLVLLALAGCGDDGDNESKDTGTMGTSGTAAEGSDRAAVEKATRAYIVEQRADEDNPEQPDAISFEDVQIDGDSAEVKAKSSLTGNRYEATLRKDGDTWRPQTLFTDVPSEPPAGGGTSGDPSQGSGREISSDEVEQQINTRLLKLLGIKGKAECPPTIKLRRGNNFDCKVTGSRKTTVKVTQKDDQGNLSYKVSTTTRP